MTRRPTPAAEVGGRFFGYRPAPAWARPLLAPLGVGADDGVAVTDDEVVATFGRLGLRVPREQVDEAHRSGPWRWYTGVGARLSLVDDGLTFSTSPEGGLCLHFDPPVPKVIGGRPTHSALSVSVVDPDGLVEALALRD